MAFDPSRIAVEPLGAHHDRLGFSCGNASLDQFIRQQAGQDTRRDLTRVWVAVDIERPTRILGFFTLSATLVSRDDLSEDVARRLPKYPIPAALIGRLAAQLDGLDGFLAPTVPIEAPTIAAMEAGDEAFFTADRLILRNPAFGNLFDLCSISLPMPLGDRLSGGLMLSAIAGRDQQLLNIAKLIEPAAAG